MRLLSVLCAAAVLALANPAAAETTIFGVNIFSENAVTNSGAATGVADGSAAIIAPGGELVLSFLHPLTGSDVIANIVSSGAISFFTLAVGEVVTGVATFSGEVAFVDFGTGGAFSANMTALCSSVSVTGCSLLRIRNLATIGGPGLAFDSVSGVTTAPEPAAWLLMIAAFIGLAVRFKLDRANGEIGAPGIA